MNAGSPGEARRGWGRRARRRVASSQSDGVDQRWMALAAAHGGVVPYAAAMDAGISPEEWRWASRSLALRRLRRGVLAPSDDLRLVLAAAQARCPQAVVSHQSAAQIHGLPLLRANPDPPTLSIAKRPRRTPRMDVGVRFLVAALPADHVTVVGSLRVTSLARTCLDVARTTQSTRCAGGHGRGPPAWPPRT